MQRAILFLFLFCVTTSAMGEASSEAETAVFKPHLRVSCLGKWDSEPLFLSFNPSLQPKDKLFKVDVLEMGYSAPIPYKSERSAVFVKRTDNQEAPYQTVLQTNIPEGYRYPLVLLIPGQKKLRYQVLDIDPSKFPYGSYLVVNYSTQHVRAAVDSEVKAIRSGRSQLFPPHDKYNQSTWIRVGVEPKGNLVFTTMTVRRPQKRMIIFLLNGPGEKLVTTRMLIDFKPAAVTPESQPRP